jgi:hypothetical protein
VFVTPAYVSVEIPKPLSHGASRDIFMVNFARTSMKAALVYILASMLFNITVVETVHIPGTENVICDLLSRQKATAESFGIDYKILTDLSDTSLLHSLLMLVDPTQPQLLHTEEDFCTFWRQAHELLQLLATEQSLCDPSLPLS